MVDLYENASVEKGRETVFGETRRSTSSDARMRRVKTKALKKLTFTTCFGKSRGRVYSNSKISQNPSKLDPLGFGLQFKTFHVRVQFGTHILGANICF